MIGVADRIALDGTVYEVKTVKKMSSVIGWDEFADLEGKQIRRDETTQGLVILIQSMYDEGVVPDDVEGFPWLVKDVLSGKVYALEEQRISYRVYNEMEALAWAATDPVLNEIAGD